MQVSGVAVALLLAVLPGGGRASGWAWPVPPPHTVVAAFDPPVHDWLAGHRGVDLAVTLGERVASAGAGTVSFAGAVAGVGVVAVRHLDGLETTYEPVRATVRRGMAVAAGTTLGVVTGGGHCPTVPCLHWGLLRDGVYLDPLSLVGAARVRLLPDPVHARPPWPVPAVGAAATTPSAVAVAWLLSRRRRRGGRDGPG